MADLDLGFQPTPSQAKRPGIRWAHTFSPQDWHELNTDLAVSNELDALLIELERAGTDVDSTMLDQIFERALPSQWLRKQILDMAESLFFNLLRIRFEVPYFLRLSVRPSNLSLLPERIVGHTG